MEPDKGMHNQAPSQASRIQIFSDFKSNNKEKIWQFKPITYINI